MLEHQASTPLHNLLPQRQHLPRQYPPLYLDPPIDQSVDMLLPSESWEYQNTRYWNIERLEAWMDEISKKE